MKKVSLYIHIPFCVSKCTYCDFVSFTGCEEYFDLYTHTLTEETKQKSKNFLGYVVDTIFIGGGTPTVLSGKNIETIMEAVNKYYDVSKDAEMTIELNPKTVDKEKLFHLKAIGFNRLSFGVQAFQNRLLNTISRIHSIEDFIQNYYEAKECGFLNINMDLMFGLPGQTQNDFSDTLSQAVKLSPGHISCYGLTLNENTPMYQKIEDKEISLMDETEERKMYDEAKRMLEQKGYHHYEISNFSQEGCECRHNIAYWTLKEYEGFGLAAHSFTNFARYHNTDDLKKYLHGDFEKLNFQTLSTEDLYEEYMFLGLRLIKGINENNFLHFFHKTVDMVYGGKIQKLIDEGLLKRQNGTIFLTGRGIDISNYVFCEFLLDR